MSDLDLRTLERSWKASESLDDYRTWARAAKREGEPRPALFLLSCDLLVSVARRLEALYMAAEERTLDRRGKVIARLNEARERLTRRARRLAGALGDLKLSPPIYHDGEGFRTRPQGPASGWIVRATLEVATRRQNYSRTGSTIVANNLEAREPLDRDRPYIAHLARVQPDGSGQSYRCPLCRDRVTLGWLENHYQRHGASRCEARVGPNRRRRCPNAIPHAFGRSTRHCLDHRAAAPRDTQVDQILASLDDPPLPPATSPLGIGAPLGDALDPERRQAFRRRIGESSSQFRARVGRHFSREYDPNQELTELLGVPIDDEAEEDE